MNNNTSSISFITFWLIIKLINSQKISCNNTANFTTNSPFATNRGILLNYLPSNVSSKTTAGSYFYAAAVGQGADRVYGHAICQPDLTPQLCSDYLTDTVQNLISTCPNQKEAISLGDHTIRYSNRPINGVVALDPTNAGNIPSDGDLDPINQVAFWDSWYRLTDEVTERASNGTAVKYATEKINTTANQTVNVRMQCFPDLEKIGCRYCLKEAVSHYLKCCRGRIGNGGYVHKPSCWFRWDLGNFDIFAKGFNIAAPSPQPITITILQANANVGGIAWKTVVEILGSSTVGFLLLTLLLCLFYRYRMRNNPTSFQPKQGTYETGTADSFQVDIQTLRLATNNFSRDNKLGEGGFGTVYKGWLSDGQAIAVKRLSKNSQQGEAEFENEVVLLAKLQHKNLVRLLGYCSQETERLLVYEFVPNRSLDSYIFDSPNPVLELDWNKRYKIIEGVARGILYLHQDSRIQIIHRDLKPGNILLDDQMNAKISDFGTAKLFEVDQSQISTHRIVGTYGYMPPEYTMYGQISIKSDVFSFGVIILEIMSGQKVNRFGYGEVNRENLLTYAWRNWVEGMALSVIDENLLSSGSIEEMIRCVHIALLCVQEDLEKRPTMASIVLMLNNTVALPLPSTPAYCMSLIPSKSHNSPELELIMTHQSVNELTMTDQAPR